MATTKAILATKAVIRDDGLSICAISALAWIFADGTHEAIGHGLTALLTGAQSGVVSTVAWSSTYDSRLVAAGGPVLNLIEAALLWIALRSATKASPQTRFFLFTSCTFCLLTATGYFLLSGVTNFGDWAQVIAGMRPHWIWQVLLAVVGAVTYFLSVRAMGACMVRYVGVSRADRRRLTRLTVLPYFAALFLSTAGGFMNPLGITLVLESALPASAGGNCGLLWLRNHVPKGAVPVSAEEGVERSYAWIAAGVVLSLAFIFVLGRGITLHR